jgi:hypothetical protein
MSSGKRVAAERYAFGNCRDTAYPLGELERAEGSTKGSVHEDGIEFSACTDTNDDDPSSLEFWLRNLEDIVGSRAWLEGFA